jgi:UDP-N-acetylmuramoylalanine--D-glutamate ligase
MAHPRPPLPPGPWLVVGLARSGIAAGRALTARGEDVVGVDAGHPEGEAGFSVRLGTDGLAELERAAAVVKSPGVPREAPVIAAARSRGVPVLGELELAWRLLDTQPWVVITGTNGKTTTTELLGAIYREAGLPHAVVGNVGTAASALVGTPLAPDATIVAEASSFQLEDTLALAPEAAALLNLEPDHLDRHGTFADYREAKLRAFARQGPEDVAYAPFDIALPGAARRVDAPPLDAGDVRVRGPHNLANARAAAALALARGVPEEAVRAALRAFPGVAHRLEEVAERDGVLYVNDSKATNVASTLVALRAFPPGTIHLLLGGQGKGQDFEPLREPVAQTCRAAYVFGEDAELIAAAIGVARRCATLDHAVAEARRHARPGDVVLLSPACASFDQYRDFEARGEHFRALATEE